MKEHERVHKIFYATDIENLSETGNLKEYINCHLFMNSDNSGYIIFHINYDPLGEYQFVNHVDYVIRSYKGVVLDKWIDIDC